MAPIGDIISKESVREKAVDEFLERNGISGKSSLHAIPVPYDVFMKLILAIRVMLFLNEMAEKVFDVARSSNADKHTVPNHLKFALNDIRTNLP